MSVQPKRLSVILVLLLITSSLSYRPASARLSPAAGTDYYAVPGRIIVKSCPCVQPARDKYGVLHTGRAALDRLLASPDVRTARPLVSWSDPKDPVANSQVQNTNVIGDISISDSGIIKCYR